MRQVLFHLPLHLINDSLPDIPIYGYGFMLFVAFVVCTWLACRLAAREGIASERIQDLAIWMFISGIAGARLTFMIQYGKEWQDFYKIWDGGLVFYGSAFGGAVGYFLAHFLVLRRHGISGWKMADIIAPCAALGLALGRFGCLFNGCCYGNVACPDCPGITFPLSGQPRYFLVDKGYQTAAGFTLDDSSNRSNRVAQVEPGSPAAGAGLKAGDHIIGILFEIDGKLQMRNIANASDLYEAFGQKEWPRGENELQLKVRHADGKEETLPAFAPRTIRLNPTQLYESISMTLLFAVLLAYYPLRRRDGEVMAVFMYGYAIHRFVNEILRVDTEPVALGMTLSQNISVLVLAGAVVLTLILWRRPVQYRPGMREAVVTPSPQA